MVSLLKLQMPCHDNSRLKRTVNGVVVQSTGAHDVGVRDVGMYDVGVCNVGVRIVYVYGADHVYADKQMGHD